MMYSLTVLRVVIVIAAGAARLYAQNPATQPEPHPLASVLQEIQTRAKKEARRDPAAFKDTAARIADEHYSSILSAAKSPEKYERSLAAMLLGMTSPSDKASSALALLASDEVPNVRYAALSAIASVGDQGNPAVKEAVLKALAETGNTSITRDASFAAAALKIPEALPIFEQLLKTENRWNKRYAAGAAARYGAEAAFILPELRRQIAQIQDPPSEPGLKQALQEAEASLSKAGESVTPPAAAPPAQPAPPSAAKLPDAKVLPSGGSAEFPPNAAVEHPESGTSPVSLIWGAVTAAALLIAASLWGIRRKIRRDPP